MLTLALYFESNGLSIIDPIKPAKGGSQKRELPALVDRAVGGTQFLPRSGAGIPTQGYALKTPR